MILAAHGLGIGSVRLGTWPIMEKVQRQREPYPEKKPDYEDDRVHFEKW